MCAYSGFACCSQVVVVDKLDYCATLNNLTFAKDNPNFKVSADRIRFLAVVTGLSTYMFFFPGPSGLEL